MHKEKEKFIFPFRPKLTANVMFQTGLHLEVKLFT